MHFECLGIWYKSTIYSPVNNSHFAENVRKSFLEWKCSQEKRGKILRVINLIFRKLVYFKMSDREQISRIRHATPFRCSTMKASADLIRDRARCPPAPHQFSGSGTFHGLSFIWVCSSPICASPDKYSFCITYENGKRHRDITTKAMRIFRICIVIFCYHHKKKSLAGHSFFLRFLP